MAKRVPDTSSSANNAKQFQNVVQNVEIKSAEKNTKPDEPVVKLPCANNCC